MRRGILHSCSRITSDKGTFGDLQKEKRGGMLRKEMGRGSREHTAAGLSLAQQRDSASEHQEPAWREPREPGQGAGDGI